MANLQIHIEPELAIGMLELNGQRAQGLYVFTEGSECGIEVGLPNDKPGATVKMRPEEMIALGHACVAAGRAAQDWGEIVARETEQEHDR